MLYRAQSGNKIFHINAILLLKEFTIDYNLAFSLSRTSGLETRIQDLGLETKLSRDVRALKRLGLVSIVTRPDVRLGLV